MAIGTDEIVGPTQLDMPFMSTCLPLTVAPKTMPSEEVYAAVRIAQADRMIVDGVIPLRGQSKWMEYCISLFATGSYRGEGTVGN